jgi:GrpB-like predicted nucleotidyltransferase (UPF0157 family)
VIDDGALIGGRERRTIEIVDYDPSWPERFERERELIGAALGPRAIAIEHVGSTAVPGLAAKPIVDLLVTVHDAEDEANVSALEGAGYELRVSEPGHRMVRRPELDVHVHVWATTDPEVERMLRFRDLLRADATARDAYAQLKRELALREWEDMNAYAEAKGPLIEQLLRR